MKNDRGVKSDVGNVEMPCLFFSPFFCLFVVRQHRGFCAGCVGGGVCGRGGLPWVVVSAKGVASRQPAWHSVPLGCIHLAQLPSSFPSFPLAVCTWLLRRYLTRKTYYGKDLNPGTHNPNPLCYYQLATFCRQKESCLKEKEKKIILIYEISNCISIPKYYSMARGFISNSIPQLPTLHTSHSFLQSSSPSLNQKSTTAQWIWPHT